MYFYTIFYSNRMYIYGCYYGKKIIVGGDLYCIVHMVVCSLRCIVIARDYANAEQKRQRYDNRFNHIRI